MSPAAIARRTLFFMSVLAAALILQWAATTAASSSVIPGIQATDTAYACPLCAQETEAQSERTGVNTSLGYALSIIFMIGMPYALISLVGFVVYKNYRAGQLDQDRTLATTQDSMMESGAASTTDLPESGAASVDKPDMTHPLYGDE